MHGGIGSKQYKHIPRLMITTHLYQKCTYYVEGLIRMSKYAVIQSEFYEIFLLLVVNALF